MVYPPRTLPTFKAWNDNLLRQRQAKEMNTIEFGSGKLMPAFTDQHKDRTDSQEEEEQEEGQEDEEEQEKEAEEEHANDNIVDDEAEEEHANDNIVDDEANDDILVDNVHDNDEEEGTEKSSDHAGSKQRAEKGKARASQSSTESGDSILGEVNSTL